MRKPLLCVEFVTLLLLFVVGSGMIYVRSVFFRPEQTVPFQPPAPKIFENCEFPKYRMDYRPARPRVVSKAYCHERIDQQSLLRELIFHMRLVAHKEGHDGLIAENFGVPIRVGYLKHYDLIVINPIFVRGRGQKYCWEKECDSCPEVIRKGRYEEVTFTTLDEDSYSSRREVTVTGPAACIIQSLFDQMNGGQEEF